MAHEVPSQDVKPWHETRWVRGLAVLVAVGIAVGVWWLRTPSLPDRQEAERDVAAQVGRAEHTTVTAHCTVPDEDGYTCRLRDAAGRHGYAITMFREDSHPGSRRGATRAALTNWGFPLDADGNGSMTLDTSAPGDLATSVFGALTMIGNSIGQPDLLSLHGAIDCGDPVSGEVTTCTVRAPVLSATVRPLGDDKYQLSYGVALPDS